MAYDTEKKQYNTLLKLAKEEIIKWKVLECKNDTKKLFKLIANITGDYKSSPFSRSNIRQGIGRQICCLLL